MKPSNLRRSVSHQNDCNFRTIGDVALMRKKFQMDIILNVVQKTEKLLSRPKGFAIIILIPYTWGIEICRECYGSH